MPDVILYALMLLGGVAVWTLILAGVLLAVAHVSRALELRRNARAYDRAFCREFNMTLEARRPRAGSGEWRW